jgi:transcriptional regulator GlxA family with amidase domain
VTAKWAGRPVRMVFLLVPQYSMMAFSGAIEPLRSANRMAERQLFEWRLASVDGNPVVASNGIPISVHESLDRLEQVDMLVVCAGLDPVQFGRSQKIHHHLRRLARHGAMVGAVSTGSFILADAGLLAGRRCTVHWEYADLFRSRHPALQATQDLFIVDRNVFTCSGGTATLDMMLHFVSGVAGPALALAVAEQLMHPHIRSSADQQRLDLHSRYGIDSTRLVEIIQLMERSIEEPVDMTDIADRVGISARHMERLFLDQIGTRPRAFYLRLRVAKARRMLRQTLNSVQHVALECGFTSTSHFCHAYKREFGLAPMRERRRACL